MRSSFLKQLIVVSLLICTIYHYGDTNINEVKDGLKNEKEIEVRIRALQ